MTVNNLVMNGKEYQTPLGVTETSQWSCTKYEDDFSGSYIASVSKA